MSFNKSNNSPDYGATDSHKGPRKTRIVPSDFDNTAYHQLFSDISCDLFHINSSVSDLEKASKKVGTQAETPFLRDRIYARQKGIKECVNITLKLFEELRVVVAKEHHLHFEMLRNNLRDTIQRYNILQKQLGTKMKMLQSLPAIKNIKIDEKQSLMKTRQRYQIQEPVFKHQSDPKVKHAMFQMPSASKNIWNDEDDKKQSLMKSQQLQQQYQIQELDFERDLLLEREESIRNIESDMQAVNEVFKDLQALIHEGGEIIETVKEDVSTVTRNVTGGHQELEKASIHKQAYRKKQWRLILVFAVIVIAVAVIPESYFSLFSNFLQLNYFLSFFYLLF